MRKKLSEAALAHIGDRPRKPIADRAGISEAQLSRFLAGEVKEPTLTFIERLEKGLELRPGTLLRAAGYVEDATSVRDAILNDPDLPKPFRTVLAGSYDEMRRYEDPGYRPAASPNTSPRAGASGGGRRAVRTIRARPMA